MQPFLVVNCFQKVSDLRSGIEEVLVFAQVYLLALQGLHKALRFGIIVGVAFAAHADGNAARLEQARIFARRILNASV